MPRRQPEQAEQAALDAGQVEDARPDWDWREPRGSPSSHTTVHTGPYHGGSVNFSSSKFWTRVPGVERSEPPELRISGGSLALDPGHPRSDGANLELLNLRPSASRRAG